MPIASIDTVLTYTTGDQTSQNLENLTNNKHLVAIYNYYSHSSYPFSG